MRCPKCGFISFDDLVACAKCHLQLEGKNGPLFTGTAIRAQYAISLVVTEAGPLEPELIPAEEPDPTGDLYRELEAEGLGAGLADETEEAALDLGEAEDGAAAAADAGEEIPVLETEEEIPTIDLSGLGTEEDGPVEEPAGADGEPDAGHEHAVELQLDLAVDEESDQLDPQPAGETGETDLHLDLVLDEEQGDLEPLAAGETEVMELDLDLGADEAGEELDLSSGGEAEEVELASPGTASNLDGIDLTGLMGEEEGAPPEGADDIYDLSDLITEEGDAGADLVLGHEHASGSAEAEGEEGLLDLTFDEPGSLDLGLLEEQEQDGGEEDLHLELELDDTDEKGREAPPVDLPPSGLSLEQEDDA